MPVSESEKLGVSLLGCHFSEKAEHIPIKKRRFLFKASSTPCNITNQSFEGAERHATGPKDTYSGSLLNPSATCLSEEVTGIGQRGSDDDKLDEKELLKTTKEIGEDDDFSGISILAAVACSNNLGAETDHREGSGIVLSTMKNPKALSTVELQEYNADSVNILNEECDTHTSIISSEVPSTNESMLVTSSQVPLESAFINTNPDSSTIQKSSARDVRLNWDLNTVMDAWDEPFVSKHELSTSDAAVHHNIISLEERKNDGTKDNSGDWELGSEREPGSPSKNICRLNLPVELKSLAHENEDLKLGNQVPDGYAEIQEPLSREFDSAQNAGVEDTVALHDNYIDSVNNAIPLIRTLSLQKPTCDTSEKWTNLAAQSSRDLGWIESVNTQLSMDCSIPPGFDQHLNLHASKESAGVSSTSVGCGNNVKFRTTATQTSRSESEKPDLSLSTTASLENGPHGGEANMKMELTSDTLAMDDLDGKQTYLPQEIDKAGPKAVNQMTFDSVLVSHSSVAADDQLATVSSMHDAESQLQNGSGYHNSQSDNRGRHGNDTLDEISVGYDSQYEDGELRDSAIHAWKRYEANEGENEYLMNNREDDIDLSNMHIHETSSQRGQEGSSGTKQTDIGSGREDADLISNKLLPDKLHSSEVPGSAQNEMISGQRNSERQDTVQHASQSVEWKMKVSGWDALPDNHRISSNNFSKTRNFSSQDFSYRDKKDGFETKEVEMKAEGSGFYRKETGARIGGSSTRDMFLSKDRFRMQECSSKAAEGLTSRSERKSGAFRSFGRGGYSPRNYGSGRGGGMWNRSPERGRDSKRLPSPSYQGTSFLRSTPEDMGSRDNVTNVTRRSFRSRSPMDRETINFRARLGLRSTRDTSHERIVNMERPKGRGGFMRYGTRLDGEGSRGRYHGPDSDEFNEYLPEYSHPFPRRRRCFSPVERRGNNNSYAHHHSDSRSPSRPRTRSPGFRCRSRSPNFRPDTKLQRLRSPNYRRGFEPDHSPPQPPPPSSRWAYYKERSTTFDRRSPDGPPEERFSFYRKPKQNDYRPPVNEPGRDRPPDYRHVGTDNGYRRGGFIRRHDKDGHAKRFPYVDEDSFGRGFDASDRRALELNARGNAKPCNNGTDSRFRDFPRRPREREPMFGGELRRRSRDPHANEQTPKDTKGQSTTSNLDSMPDEVVKEGDDKPVLGSNQSTMT